MRLTATACAGLWRSARTGRVASWEGRAACRGCPVGAARAGVSAMALQAEVAAANWSEVCSRCFRGGRIINGRFCVSCFNRQREALRGRNAKGSRPALADRLHSRRFLVCDAAGTGGERVVRLDAVAGPGEAFAEVARGAEGALSFGVQAPVGFRPVVRQLVFAFSAVGAAVARAARGAAEATRRVAAVLAPRPWVQLELPL